MVLWDLNIKLRDGQSNLIPAKSGFDNQSDYRYLWEETRWKRFIKAIDFPAKVSISKSGRLITLRQSKVAVMYKMDRLINLRIIGKISVKYP